MIDLELYKPKQEILDLDDEVIELWYGNLALKFVRIIGNIELHNDIYKHINYNFGDDFKCFFNPFNKGFVVEDITIKKLLNQPDMEYNHINHCIKQLKPIIHDLFNYKIDNIW